MKSYKMYAKRLKEEMQMTLVGQMLMDEGIQKGREEGREEGRAEIRAELNEFKLLNKYLLKSKRYNDLERATEDIEYQKKLLKEFGIELNGTK